ncbi:MAG: hypothetical protein PHV59_00480, partial [Victivallales bacterium]|nr:hypothetical protein [Victivallales bacterium]
MNILFSLSAWYDFFFERLMLDAVFIVFVFLFVLGLFSREKYPNTPQLRFLFMVFIFALLSRYIHFIYAATRINTRYLFTTAFYALILCLPGYS